MELKRLIGDRQSVYQKHDYIQYIMAYIVISHTILRLSATGRRLGNMGSWHKRLQ